ncbi:MAG: hypothetical protein V4509_04320 [Patescibacteria group bacterium]
MNHKSPLMNITALLIVNTLLGHGQCIRAGTTLMQPIPRPTGRRGEDLDDWMSESEQPQLEFEAYKFKTGLEPISSLFEDKTSSPFACPAKTHKGNKLRRPTY